MPPLLRLPPRAAPAAPGSASSACWRRGRCCGGAGGCAAISTSGTRPRGAARVPVPVPVLAGGSRCRWTPPRAGPAPHQPRSLGAFAQLVQQALPPKPPSPRPGGGAELSARLGLAGEESEDEGAGSGGSAIDNKIERAMDLVKSHLLLAVREEVEALREQIRELSERRAALERENRLLRALATPQQLARLPALPPPGPP
ncbi:TSC22 domain family protein 4-like [Motacilla alba alba]|uniref:TSC22 domain family protein 4-like n=1 Tax=Motacilla alba alba TaxID=1094192 RepID=UPI0018D4E410|nr:TSC22 domain family protein 4-like [Motacilla alba alba]